MDRTDHATRADRAQELHQQLEAGIAALTESDDWATYLSTAAQFHNYSAGNVMLILRQRPDATRVAGYQTWRQLGRQVRKGERGIAILAPMVVGKRGKAGSDSDDGRTGERDDDGRRVLVGFRVAHVFDVSQTDGEPIADVRPELLEGDAPGGLWDSLAAQVEAAGFTLERGDCGGANGITIYGSRTVRVRDDVSDAQACKTLAHELAHVLLHEGSLACRDRVEVEAESVAYVIGTACGLSTAGYSFPYVARWAKGDTKLVKATAERVVSTARAVLAKIADAGAELVEVAA